MTEDQAIERIAAILRSFDRERVDASIWADEEELRDKAKAVWNEIKAIAREDMTPAYHARYDVYVWPNGRVTADKAGTQPVPDPWGLTLA